MHSFDAATGLLLFFERKKFIDRKFPSDNTMIKQINTLLTYKEKYNLKSVVPSIFLKGVSSALMTLIFSRLLGTLIEKPLKNIKLPPTRFTVGIVFLYV